MKTKHALPIGWISTTLGEAVAYGKTEKVEPSQIPDDAWVLELEDIEKDSSKILKRVTFAKRRSKSTKSRFDRGDVLYGKLRPYLNKVVIADAPGYCTTEIVPLRPNDRVEGRYLFYWLKHPAFLKYVTGASHGLNMPRLGTEAARNAPFLVAPRAEQERIADKLDRLFAATDRCKARIDGIPAILKRFRQSVLAAAVSGKLTEEWRAIHADRPVVPNLARYSGEHDVNALLGERLPDSWQVTSIDRLCTDSFYGPRFGADEYTPGGLPTIRTTDMTEEGRIILKDPPEVRVPSNRLDDFLVRPGDLLITRTGSIGRMAVFEGEYQAIPSAYLIRFRFDENVLPRYVFLWLMSPVGQRMLGLSATAITQPNINARSVRALPIPLPSLDEQRKIISRADALLGTCDELVEHTRTISADVEKLTHSLLNQAFCGELVPQDPNDEPAAVQSSDGGSLGHQPTRRQRVRSSVVRVSEEGTSVSKSRDDEDVKGRPYLRNHLQELNGRASIEELFKRADLPVTDFYKQLTWEVDSKFILDAGSALEAVDAT